MLPLGEERGAVDSRVGCAVRFVMLWSFQFFARRIEPSQQPIYYSSLGRIYLPDRNKLELRAMDFIYFYFGEKTGPIDGQCPPIVHTLVARFSAIFVLLFP